MENEVFTFVNENLAYSLRLLHSSISLHKISSNVRYNDAKTSQ